MVGMGLSTQQIYVNVRVGSFAAYLIKADAPEAEERLETARQLLMLHDEG